jgi:hypothetical protein
MFVKKHLVLYMVVVGIAFSHSVFAVSNRFDVDGPYDSSCSPAIMDGE